MPVHLLLLLLATILTLAYAQQPFVINGANIRGGDGGDGSANGNGGQGGTGLIIGTGPIAEPPPPQPTTLAPMIEAITSAPATPSQDGSLGLYILWAAGGAVLVLVMFGLVYGCRRTASICIRPPPFAPPKLSEDTNDRYTPYVERGVVE
ncbi:hypothetical protein PRIPAC_70445 [Pristionchus pacificus]|uniref:Uncharacterized protein n=1 Tax=Pristionchus pacificus TaxID=54126 RepID=A0A2A6C5D8_PRIPA|nr:hypothetical protein PRIPAC_70445 [Pristionchus pacificus]|eukprot:PDM73263.1 hypothetical protein PRIPAC_40619 [Pristionchus pacificus]